MKYVTPIALALVLGACTHTGKDVDAVDASLAEDAKVVEVETVEEAADEMVEEIVEEVEAPAEETVETVTETTTVQPASSSTGIRRVTRRVVTEHSAGTPTAPAIAGSAANDTSLSAEPVIVDETAFTTGSSQTVTTAISEEAGDVEEIVEAPTDAADDVMVDDVDVATDAASEAVEDAIETAEDAATDLITDAVDAADN